MADVYVNIFKQINKYFDHVKKYFHQPTDQDEALRGKARAAPSVSFTPINNSHIRPAEPVLDHSTSIRPSAISTDSWQYYREPHHEQALPPTQASATILEPVTIAHQPLDQAVYRYSLFEELQKQEKWRWGSTGDLRLLATGESQGFDELVAGMLVMFPSTDSDAQMGRTRS